MNAFFIGENMITHEYLLTVVSYNPDTGIFTRLVKTSNSVTVGDVAGTINGKGYLVFHVGGKLYRAQRLAWFYMTGRWPEFEIDHKNTIRTDNRWSNLRECTRIENQRNTSVLQSNTSGYKGVSLTKNKKKWRAYATVNKKQINLGVFDTALLASKAYETYAKENFNEFYRGI